MQKKSIYKYAAEAGLPVGLYLTLISACFLMSFKFNFLSMAILPLVLMFPFYLGYTVKKIGKLEPQYLKFSSLWLGGIYTVIFGTLICMLFSTVYIMFIEPGFMQMWCGSIIETLEESSLSEEYSLTIEMLQRMQETHTLPTASDFVITMGWWTCFSGSILSLLIALIIGHKSKNINRAPSID